MHVSQGPTKVDVRFLLEYEKKILRTNKDLIENGARRQVNLDVVKKSISESEKRIQSLQKELLQGVTEVDPRMYYNNSQVPLPVQNQMQQSMMQNQPIMMQPAMMAGQPVMMQPAMVQPGMQPMQMQPQQPVNVQPAQFSPFTGSYPAMYQPENIDLIRDVPLEVTVELGRTHKSIQDILDFAPGTIIELNKIAGEPIDVLVNGKYVAKGEVVVIEESFGIRITEILK